MIPENLSLLHGGEEDLRQKTIALIEASHDMSVHMERVESAMDMFHYIRTNTPEMTDDQVIVALIGASIFNSLASAIKLIFGGYYQSSGLQIRYVLESGWLLDYLRTDKALVQKWKTTHEDQRQKVFAPYLVRQALDKRDGFKEKKRDAHYKRLCVLCGHPSFAGFALLRPQSGADAHMGPFLEITLLEQIIQELVMVANVAIQAFMRFYQAKTANDFKARIAEMEGFNRWYEHVYEKKPDTAALDQLKRLVVQFEAQI